MRLDGLGIVFFALHNPILLFCSSKVNCLLVVSSTHLCFHMLTSRRSLLPICCYRSVDYVRNGRSHRSLRCGCVGGFGTLRMRKHGRKSVWSCLYVMGVCLSFFWLLLLFIFLFGVLAASVPYRHLLVLLFVVFVLSVTIYLEYRLAATVRNYSNAV